MDRAGIDRSAGLSRSARPPASEAAEGENRLIVHGVFRLASERHHQVMAFMTSTFEI
jgi:hypothetical protein